MATPAVIQALRAMAAGKTMESDFLTSCLLTLEATGKQQTPRSGNVKLLVRVGRNVRHSCSADPYGSVQHDF